MDQKNSENQDPLQKLKNKDVHYIIKTNIVLHDYGSEMWTLKKLKELRLVIFERKVLSKIYGTIFNNKTNEWRKLNNYELQIKFQGRNTVKEIAKRRLMWADHALRKQESLVRQVIEKGPIGKKPFGRLRLIWEDNVNKDKTTEPEIRQRKTTENRYRWQDL